MRIISRADAKRLGLQKYFTGRPCPAGHRSERSVHGWTCCQCEIESQKERYATDAEYKQKRQTAARERYRSK